MLNNGAKYRARLPQLSDRIFLTDGGMETTLIFHEGIDLPYFASFDLLKNAEGIEQRSPLLRPLRQPRAPCGAGLRAGKPDLAG